MKKLTEEEIEDISAKIDNEGFAYYFIDYGPDKKLIKLIEPEYEAYKKAHYALVGAVRNLGIDQE